jgi:glycosyltransferase involved in cell wall biosynthesis
LTYTIGYPAWSLTFKKELEWSTLSVAVSKNLKSDLLNEMGRVYNEKIHVVHNGIDIESLDKDYQKEAHSKEPDNTILFAGRLFWSKGSLALVKLAYLLQKESLNFRIIVHGEGPLFQKIKRSIVAYKLTNIELKGFANRQQLMRSMRLCRFILIPSFYEACPMILLEGMCMGKIPLMFDLPYAREFTKNGEYGILATNVKDMVSKIKTMQQNHLKNLEQKIRRYARMKYNIDVIAQKYYHLYKIISDSCN